MFTYSHTVGRNGAYVVYVDRYVVNHCLANCSLSSFINSQMIDGMKGAMESQLWFLLT